VMYIVNMALIYMTLYQFSNDTTTSCNRPIPVHLNDIATTNDMFSSKINDLKVVRSRKMVQIWFIWYHMDMV
jgi:hypothetical protein